jgi:hypothetical protein
MLKLLGLLFLLGVTFAVGYEVGQHGPAALLQKARGVSSEVVAKAMALERGQSARASLLHAKERLVQAKSDLLDKNYGKAVSGLEETAQALSQARVDAADDLRPRLDALTRKISDIGPEAKSLRPGVIAKINESVKEIDALLNR